MLKFPCKFGTNVQTFAQIEQFLTVILKADPQIVVIKPLAGYAN